MYGVPTTTLSLSDQQETKLMNGQFPGRTTAEAAVNVTIDPKYLVEIRHGKAWFP